MFVPWLESVFLRMFKSLQPLREAINWNIKTWLSAKQFCINPLLICKNKSCIQGLQTPPRCAAQKIYQILNTLTFTKLSGFSSIFFIPRHAHSAKCKHDSESPSLLISESESGSTLGSTWSVFVTLLPKNEGGGARCLSSPLSHYHWEFE